MIEPTKPIDETARLMSLHSLRILDTAPEDRYDRITRMAKRVFGVDICLVTLVDSGRQWFKSKQGLDACETSRATSFCGHAIFDESILIIPDAMLDPRFSDNPLVTGEPFIRFYAGCPIHSPDGHRIGTLCLIHSEPRDFPNDDQATLRDLAAMIDDELRVTSQITVDELTQLANRRGFNNVASHILEISRRLNSRSELLAFDLNDFKSINDTHGHLAGDMLLQHFSKLLIKCFRSADVVARLGGDEFVVLTTGSDTSSEAALARLQSLAAAAECPVNQKLAWSVGTIVFDPHHHCSVESLLSDADAQMYKDKEARRRARA